MNMVRKTIFQIVSNGKLAKTVRCSKICSVYSEAGAVAALQLFARQGADEYCVTITMRPSDLDRTIRDVFGPYKPKTNADRIRTMTDAELADFLHEATMAADTPWNYAFSKAFCDACEPDTCDRETECPNGRPVDWWLGQEVQGK
ncbi:MAG: hypothetical protein IJ960_00815 [Oscillospiraceae bacterium]|nr:hypothetical protein [Oscillospiraceae bacterium]